MEKRSVKISIIGAGISGLMAAKVLEANGYFATIYEKTDSAGGRVKTDLIAGYQLDHGFQVLLEAYPMVQKYLDLEELALQKFLPGAVIFRNGKQMTLGDPLRDFSLLLPTLGSSIGNLKDKWKIIRLSLSLKSKTIDQIFAEDEMTTKAFLEQKGFSEDMIACFFKPFFSGIFLEPDLATSSRMFQFVFKMFGEGFATLPKNGISAIPAQLLGSLTKSKILYNSTITSLTDVSLNLSDGTENEFDYAIIATEPLFETPKPLDQKVSWKHCDVLYFTAKKRIIEKALIGLIADESALINNIFYHTSLETGTRATDELLSVTVVKEHQLGQEALIEKVQHDLETYCGITELTFVKHYTIPKALPNLQHLKNRLAIEDIKLSDHIFLAGDFLLNGSLNAAMIAGETAALALVKTIENSSSTNSANL
ncbi:FAD-dependent oxidoreductase [Cellulophaga sp. Hel_I_12]|uniref:FAD-dependent oxidoreductase n=1 Tax=Cellulophaga sp. Hel_I_12 TaxID=1249972 RepID=UPI00064684B7|nr:FAD-dependent oxidoreductase [Cellulophaga sp. Hel_I_12]